MIDLDLLLVLRSPQVLAVVTCGLRSAPLPTGPTVPSGLVQHIPGGALVSTMSTTTTEIAVLVQAGHRSIDEGAHSVAFLWNCHYLIERKSPTRTRLPTHVEVQNSQRPNQTNYLTQTGMLDVLGLSPSLSLVINVYLLSVRESCTSTNYLERWIDCTTKGLHTHNYYF